MCGGGESPIEIYRDSTTHGEQASEARRGLFERKPGRGSGMLCGGGESQGPQDLGGVCFGARLPGIRVYATSNNMNLHGTERWQVSCRLIISMVLWTLAINNV